MPLNQYVRGTQSSPNMAFETLASQCAFKISSDKVPLQSRRWRGHHLDLYCPEACDAGLALPPCYVHTRLRPWLEYAIDSLCASCKQPLWPQREVWVGQESSPNGQVNHWAREGIHVASDDAGGAQWNVPKDILWARAMGHWDVRAGIIILERGSDVFHQCECNEARTYKDFEPSQIINQRCVNCLTMFCR